MTSHPKKVIITGFEPFGSYTYNPSMDLVQYVNGEHMGQCEIIGIVLPCTYKGAFEMLSKIIDDEKPDIILNFGLSSSVLGVRLEGVYRNMMHSKYADAEGYMPDHKPICEKADAEEFILAHADLVKLGNMLHAHNIPIEVSANADNFICNSLAYLVTKKITEENLKTKNIFIHIPWTDDYAGRMTLESGKIFLQKDLLHKALRLIIENI